MKWEAIPSTTLGQLLRTPIFGGWLVQQVDDVRSPVNTGYAQPDYTDGFEWRTTMTFVPDPNHEWDLNKDYGNQIKDEFEKCKTSPYYYYTKYLTIGGKKATTDLSEEEFNKQFNDLKNGNTHRR